MTPNAKRKPTTRSIPWRRCRRMSFVRFYRKVVPKKAFFFCSHHCRLSGRGETEDVSSQGRSGQGRACWIGGLVLLGGSDAWRMSSSWRFAVLWKPAWNSQAGCKGWSFVWEKSRSISFLHREVECMPFNKVLDTCGYFISSILGSIPTSAGSMVLWSSFMFFII